MHMEAQKYVWEGAIPLQIHLHESEVTTLPPPPPTLVSHILYFFPFASLSFSLKKKIKKSNWFCNLIKKIQFQILAPRIGYLPLLVGLIRPYFSSALPPGVDTVWFEYKGLPLKWYHLFFFFF